MQQLRGNRFFFPKGKNETWNKSKLKGSVWHWIWWVLPTVPATQEAEMDCLSLECGNQHVQHSQILLTKDKRPITWHFRKHSSYFQHNSFQRPRLTAQYMKTGTFTLLNTSPLMMKRHLCSSSTQMFLLLSTISIFLTIQTPRAIGQYL